MKFRDEKKITRWLRKTVSFKNTLMPSLLCLNMMPAYAVVQNQTYYIQAGSYSQRADAEKFLHKLLSHRNIAGRVNSAKINGRTYYQVQLGPFREFSQAKSVQQSLAAQGKNTFIRSYGGTHQQAAIVQASVKHPAIHHVQKTQLMDMVKTQVMVPRTPPAKKNSPSVLAYEPAPRFFGVPYGPRVYAEGTLAEVTDFADADAMLPFIGNNDWIGYADVSGKYGDDSAWYAGGGLGLRGVYGEAIWGIYAFMDRNISPYNQAVWVANPGIEYINPIWDARINGYWPVDSRDHYNGTFLGSELGLNTASIVNRTLYDNLYNVWDVTGPGIDGEVGYTAPYLYNIRAFVGGYHFSLSHTSDINGIEGGIEVPLGQNLTLLARDAYDNVQGNTIMGTLRLTFGAPPKTGDVHDRLLDPVQRHLGAYQTGSGVPIIRVNEFSHQVSVLTNLWFFSPGGPAFNPALGVGNCTYGNPCGVLSQAAIDGIDALAPDANLLFNTGTYDNPLVGNGLTLANGQGFYGRTNNFLSAARGLDRPFINDSLFLSGRNTLQGLQINGQSVVAGYHTAVFVLDGASDNLINQSALNVLVEGAASNVVGLHVGGSTTVIDSSINLTAQNGFAGNVGGIIIFDSLNLINSDVNVNMSDFNTINNTSGIWNTSGGSLNMQNSSINVSTQNGGGFLAGITNIGNAGLYNTSINVFGDNTSNSVLNIYGINNGTSAQLHLDTVLVNVGAVNTTAEARGLGVDSGGSAGAISYVNTKINTYADSPATAVVASGPAAAYVNLGNNICTVTQDNVTTVQPCPG